MVGKGHGMIQISEIKYHCQVVFVVFNLYRYLLGLSVVCKLVACRSVAL